MVRWLRCHNSNAGATGSMPCWGTMIPHAAWCSQQNKIVKIYIYTVLNTAYVTKEGPMGLAWGDYPISSPSALLWNTEIIISHEHFLSPCTEARTPTKWKVLTTWWPWACSPQTYRCLRMDNVNPCDIALLFSHKVRSNSLWSHGL